MTDIVEALRVNNITIALPDGSVKFVRHVAADEIEMLRAALREIKDYDGHCNVIYDADDAIGMMEIARAALGEKE